MKVPCHECGTNIRPPIKYKVIPWFILKKGGGKEKVGNGFKRLCLSCHEKYIKTKGQS